MPLTRRFAFFWVFVAALGGAAMAAETVDWVQDWNEAKRRMAAENKPGLLYFYNYKARPCKLMDDETFTDAQVMELMENFVPVRLHMETNRHLIQAFELFKVPTVIFFDETQGKIDQAIGYKPADQFVVYLQQILRRYPHLAQNLSAATGATQPTFPPRLSPTSDLVSPGPDLSSIAQAPPPLQIIPGAEAFEIAFEGFYPSASNVGLVGDFNDWNVAPPLPLERDAAGNWSGKYRLPQGIYEYKFYVDGEYMTDESNPHRRPDPYGGYNSVAIAGNPSHINPKIARNPSDPNQFQATWEYYDEVAESVEIAANFTDWKPVQMFRNPGKRGEWGIYFILPPGEYQYKFIVDGTWLRDPDNFLVDPNDGNRNNLFSLP